MNIYAHVAQSIEHFTRNEKVVGLIPAMGLVQTDDCRRRGAFDLTI